MSRKVRFTRRASDKFDFLKKYDFVINERDVEDVIANPDRLDHQDDIMLALKSLDDQYGLRVVYKRTNDNIFAVTTYPVRRERFSV